MRILFVDDERRVLVGIERMLFGMGRDWEILLAGSGDEALAELERGPVDVVVSDMRMPGMDGAELLRRVQQGWPSTLRMLLSGHTETDAAMRALNVAQQFLSKPCEPEALVGTIEDSLRIADEAKAQRRTAEAELAKCEQEIRRALSAATSRERNMATRPM